MTRILIVDDDTIIRKILSHYLKGKGYDVLAAQDGRESLALAETEQPDLILMDMRMPVLDGWQATRLLKAGKATGNIPVIALTTQTLDSDLRKCLDAGCDSVLTKPVQLPDLSAEIKRVLHSPGQSSPKAKL